jgi:hypothetical protein
MAATAGADAYRRRIRPALTVGALFMSRVENCAARCVPRSNICLVCLVLDGRTMFVRPSRESGDLRHLGREARASSTRTVPVIIDGNRLSEAIHPRGSGAMSGDRHPLIGRKPRTLIVDVGLRHAGTASISETMVANSGSTFAPRTRREVPTTTDSAAAERTVRWVGPSGPRVSRLVHGQTIFAHWPTCGSRRVGATHAPEHSMSRAICGVGAHASHFRYHAWVRGAARTLRPRPMGWSAERLRSPPTPIRTPGSGCLQCGVRVSVIDRRSRGAGSIGSRTVGARAPRAFPWPAGSRRRRRRRAGRLPVRVGRPDRRDTRATRGW